MPTPHKPVAGHLKTSRSKISNSSHLHQNADGRSAPARRFRDLMKSYIAEIGADLSESDLALVRQAVAVTMAGERMQQDLANGLAVDSDALIRLGGTSRRLLGAISDKAATRKPNAPLTLADHLAARAAESASDNDGE